MEINIETAVRICPALYNTKEVLCVQPNIYNNTLQLCNTYSYPFSHVLPMNSSQSGLFSTTIEPLLNYLFEGCDVSVVTLGQSRSGKSYTLLGPGLDCALSESEYGIIPRFLREIFSSISQNSKNCMIHITWTQINGENVQDLLGMGNVECTSVSEAFELLQLGMNNITGQGSHTLFTVTLEQQWILESTVQHKISTASFVDLSSCEKMVTMDANGFMQSLPVDSGLLTLQRSVWALSEPCNVANHNIPYNQSALTMLLKDSFGGRAKTLLICCISPILRDFVETYYTLQFAMRAQMIKNFVTVNSYTTYEIGTNDNIDLFGLQFATNQLLQLVVNAEDLFKKLILTGSLSKSQLEQISRWLTLKQECEDCISESSERPRSLEIIEEATEDICETASEESETTYEADPQTTCLQVEELMQNFYSQTTELVSSVNEKSNLNVKMKEESCGSSYNEYHLKGARGRRGSIHSAEDFFPFRRNSAPKIIEESTNFSQTGMDNLDAKRNMNFTTKQKILNRIRAEIEGCEKQINEVELTIRMKEKLMQQLLKYKNTRVSAKGKLKQKYKKLQNELQIARSRLLQAKVENDHDVEQKCYLEISEIGKKLQDAENIKDIAEDSAKTIEELENSLGASKKQLEKLKRIKQKEEDLRSNFETELIEERKRNSQNQAVNKSDKFCDALVLRKASTSTASSYSVKKSSSNNVNTPSLECSEKIESLKHEIKELRKIRDCLLDQRCKISVRLQNRKLIDDVEEQKLIYCEEAIEIIDLAIEYKNRVICSNALPLNNDGHVVKQAGASRMLLEQLDKFNENEVKSLLQKYFDRVVDLRSTSKKLECQVLTAESENEELLKIIQNLSRNLQRVRFEAERRVLSLQQQHEDKLQLMMRYLSSNESSDSKNVVSHVIERSKQAALALQVAQGTGKQIDKRNLIARFTRYARHETFPRQLQAATTSPQAKVTIQKNKLIIQQSKK